LRNIGSGHSPNSEPYARTSFCYVCLDCIYIYTHYCQSQVPRIQYLHTKINKNQHIAAGISPSGASIDQKKKINVPSALLRNLRPPCVSMWTWSDICGSPQTLLAAWNTKNLAVPVRITKDLRRPPAALHGSRRARAVEKRSEDDKSSDGSRRPRHGASMWRGKAEGANFRRPWRPTARSLSGVAAVADARDLPGPGRDDDEVGVPGDGGVCVGHDQGRTQRGGPGGPWPAQNFWKII
jgi:hypothetical protein